MALKNMIDRFRNRRRDRGAGLIETLAGIALASIIIGAPILYFTTVNQSAAGNAAIQQQNTAIGETLDRTVANVQASDTILYAGPNELVTRSTEVQAGQPDTPVITRWVLSGTTLYQEIWTGDAGVASYNRGTVPTAVGGAASKLTRVAVDDLQPAGPLYTYTDKDKSNLNVTSDAAALTETPRAGDAKTTYDIALVTLAIKAGTVDSGTVENKTSAAPRSVSGAPSVGTAALQCPAVTVDTVAGQPVVTFKTLPGYTSYQVTRNNAIVTVISTASSETEKSWTDSGVVAGPTESIQYRVQARDAAGNVASLACAPRTWTPQIAAPVLASTGPMVFPAAPEARDWTDGPDGALALTKPRITLTWNAVPGATGYELKYRELDAVTGAPLTTGFSRAAANLPPTATTFTWDDGGWARSYEWFIKANAGIGQAQSVESAHVKTLTHPAAPQNVTISPEYGTGSTRLTHGTNVITWDASPTAVEYHVWRYNTGSSGAVTRLAVVDAASARTYSDSVPYGTEYTYYIAAINNGPRGTVTAKASSANPEAGAVTASGTMPTVSSQRAATGPVFTTASYRGGEPGIVRTVSTPVDPAPKPVSQLQYPPVPESGYSRDYDGYNMLAWQPTLSADGYQISRFDVVSGTKTCLTADCGVIGGSGVTETVYRDPAATGTQFDYAVQAYNDTGLSVELSLKKTMTQRPAAPSLATVRAPSLTDRSADFRVVQNADAGNTAGNKFCTAATCEYELSKSGSAVATQDHTQSGANADFLKADSPDGATTTFTARSKNGAVTNGGYSDPITVTVKTYPGKFSVLPGLGDRYGKKVARYRLSTTNIDMGTESNGATNVRWGSIPGGSTLKVVRKALAGDVVSTTLGLSPAVAPTNVYTTSAAGVDDDLAAPGAAFRYELTATATNGLQRTVISQPIITPADISRAGTMVVTCSGTDDRRFTAAQVGSTSDGSFWYGAYSKPYPYQKIAAQMVWSDSAHPESLDGRPRYGGSTGTSYLGVASSGTNMFSGNSYYYTGWNYSLNGQYTSSRGDFASGPGVGYYQGVTGAFYAVTRGLDRTLTNPATGLSQVYNAPDSYYVNPRITAIATFQSGCGPAYSTGTALVEPKDACYTFDGTACKDPAYWNRPKWVSR